MFGIYSSLKYIHSPIIVIDKNWIIKYSNNIKDVLNYEKHKIKGKNIQEIIKNFSNTTHGYITKHKNENRKIGRNRDIIFLNKNNNNIHCEISLENFKNDILIIINEYDYIFKDIIDYKYFFDSCTDMFVVASWDGYFIHINDSLCNTLGYTREELYSKKLFEFIYEKDVMKTNEEFMEILNGKDTINFINRYVTKSGDIRQFKWWASTYGNSIYAIARDITEDNIKTNKIYEFNQMVSLTESLSKTGSSKLNLETKKYTFTDGCKKLFNINEDDTDYTHIIQPDDLKIYQDSINKCIIEENSYEVIFRINTDKFRYIKSIGKYIILDSTPTIISMKIDITEEMYIKNELEQSLDMIKKTSDAKTLFLANMSHEIRTPMNSILGMSTLLETTTLDKEQLEYNKTIKENCSILLSLINNILTFSKLDIGDANTLYETFDLNEFINTIDKEYRLNILNKNIDFIVESHFENCLIETDKLKLRQLITNLLNNAIKFTETGKITYITKIIENILEIKISDTGIGISKENQLTLFKPFRQIDISSTKIYEGTGLGLAICKSLVNILGGDIILESEEFIGTTFTITIPITQKSNNKNLHIIIVQDNKSNQYVITKYLEKIGYASDDIVIFHNGHDMLENIYNIPPSIIFMDLHMPYVDGFSCASILRLMGVDIPIIAVTANIMNDVVDKCNDAGIDDIIYKPYTLDILQKKINKWLKN